MQRPAFSQSPKRVGSGPSRPPISRGRTGEWRVAWDCGLASARRRAGSPGARPRGRSGGRSARRAKASYQPAILPDVAYVLHRALGLRSGCTGQNEPGQTMNDDPTQALRAVLLPGFGVLRIGGADAVTFLQGQFTNDVRLLADGRTQVAALLHEPGTRDRAGTASARPTMRSTRCCPPTCSARWRRTCASSCCAPRSRSCRRPT